ncbi:T9SS type A sorting domain-containing protein [Chryseobacterium sp. Tr-659]|uniref:T9SS type A sorting domain-containing protein n=1 Tax=Chryseobacterium sp. Tr-659 TaxID=2608340 RepID=UPI0014228E10|nr:T9SS type A sorting domain-containing protein [Chryseobacterium sp. Tr-659]NIF05995.1 T9SS type A sorting domain-containing protein [Chryseobacterium sp. Tr-659]
MKKITTLSAVALCSLMDAQYCQPTFQYGADSNMITNVTFGNINNTSPFQSGTTQTYEDFTSLSTSLQSGNSYPISVKGPSGTFPSDVMVFIDFNGNGSFNDAGESFYIGRLEAATPANAFTINGNITVPANASAGTTRMRVLKNSNVAAYSNPNAPSSIQTACDTGLRAGQAEDYTINVQPENLSTKEISKDSSVKVKLYPNPATSLITVIIKEGFSKYELYNMAGQKILEGSSMTVNMENLIPGTYLIQIQTKDQKIITEKIIKK